MLAHPRLALPAALTIAALLSSCASILSDKVYPVTFQTNPTGGQVSITNESGGKVYQGPTPITLSLAASEGYFDGETYAVEASLLGYPTTAATMDTTIDPWYIGNVLFGGLIGLIFVDPLTGAMYQLDDTFVVDLAPSPTPTDGVGGDNLN